jgi:phage terminase large subunit-like protein
VWASRGKYVRAEPVSALYEQGRVHHAGSFAQLEDQLCSWVSDMDRAAMGSPDRGDALVWALTELMVDSDLSESRALFTSVQMGSKRWPVYDPAHGWS